MANLSDQLEGYLSNLRNALQEQNETEIDRSEREVREFLLRNEDYQFIGDERLLAQVDILLTEALGEAAEADLLGLRQYLSRVQDIHNKLYAVLNANNDLDSLLLHHLAEWTEFPDSIPYNFSDSTKSELHKARTTGDSEQRLKAFFETLLTALRVQGLSEVADRIALMIRQPIEGYTRLRQWPVYVLFALGDGGDVYGVKVTSMASGKGEVRAINTIGEDMQTAARKAIAYIAEKRPATRNWDFLLQISREDIQYDGASIGLGLTLSAWMWVDNLEVDAYTAFTGRVDPDGSVRHIEHLSSKLQSARALGVRRVFIPQENVDECEPIEGLKIIGVATVDEALNKLRSTAFLQESADLKRLAENKIQELTIALKESGIQLVSQDNHTESCIRVEYSNLRETIVIMIYHAKQLNPVVQGKESQLKQKVQAACNSIFGKKTASEAAGTPAKPEIRKYTIKITADQQKLLRHLLNRGDGIRESENNCIYRMKITKGAQTVYVRQFTNGTLTVTGLPPLLNEIDSDVKAVIGINDSSPPDKYEIAKNQAQVDAVNAIDLGEMWIGTDEAGKGDYYGPLVAAAVLVNQKLAAELQLLGVKDSKTSSDKRNLELAATIRRLCGTRAQVVTIPPERYNALYEQFQREGKNLNTLLAWGHTRALEDILTEYPQQEITVIVDKFGDERFVQNKLLGRSREAKLNLVQLPKAEANIAVAAASVLARAQFLQYLGRMIEQYKIDFPKGASDPRIVQVGRQVIARFSENELRKVAKLHFATTQKIHGSH